MAKNTFNLEKGMATLEEYVNTMENGELTLEESLELFKKGTKLTEKCHAALLAAEQKVMLWTADGERLYNEAFIDDNSEHGTNNDESCDDEQS